MPSARRAPSVEPVRTVRTESGVPRVLRGFARRCAESGGDRAERRTERTRRTGRKPVGVPWRDERKRRDEGRTKRNGRRQGVREHYSVESDALPENDRKRVSRGKYME